MRYILTSLLPLLLFAEIINVKNAKELHLALKESCSNGSDDEIILEEGIYKTGEESIGTFTYKGIDGKNLTIKSKSEDALTVTLDGEYIHTILSLTSTTPIELTIDGITLQQGYSDHNGSAIYTNQPLLVKNATLKNNRAKGSGGAIYGLANIKIQNSTINYNYCGYGASGSSSDTLGGGAIHGEHIESIDSEFSQNRAYYSKGGAIYGDEVLLLRSKLAENSTTSLSDAGAIYSKTKTVAINSTFIKNSASSSGGALYTKDFLIINSNFWENISYAPPSGIYGKGIMVNSVINGSGFDFKAAGTSSLYNNYLDYPSLLDIENNASQTIYMSQNVQLLDGESFFDAQQNIIEANATTIDSGLDLESTTFKNALQSYESNSTMRDYIYSSTQSDLVGNMRVFGGSIDIGAYEYGADSYNQNPIITNFGYSGNTKDGEELEFTFVVTATDSREIIEYSFDFGDGLFTIFTPEFSENVGRVTHTFEKSGSYTIRLRVKDDYGAITIASLSINISQSCDLTPYELNQSDIDPLGAGWHLLGAPKDIYIPTALPEVQRVWRYGNRAWSLYDKNGTKDFDTIEQKEGFWIYKE